MASDNQKVIYHFNTSFSFRHRRLVRSAIIDLFKQENILLDSLAIIFCSDTQIHQLNLQFLSHDTLTDILTFPFSALPHPVIGEIYISVDRVRENAAQYKVPSFHELLRIIFHGCLHLCGYGDKTARLKKMMTQKEDFYLSQFFHRST